MRRTLVSIKHVRSPNSSLPCCAQHAFHPPINVGEYGPFLRRAASVVKETSILVQKHGSPSVQLRPYQEDSIQAILDYLAKGENRLGISLATGSGKTVIFSHLIDRVPAPKPTATQTLVLAHRRELVEQAATHCRRLYPERSVEIEMGNQKATGNADITVASIQSITSADRIFRFDPALFKLVLVDEAHHIVSPSYMEVLRHFKLSKDSEHGHTALVGVSATFSRHDGVGLGAAIDHIVYHKDYLDMIEDDWLANVIFTTVQTGVDLSKVKTSKGDFQTGSLSKAINKHETNTLTVRAWMEKASNRRSTLVFCVDLSHVSNLTTAFREHGIDAQFVTSHTEKKSRAEKLESFKAGRFPVLLNCGIFTEGTDIPNIDCILLARPTKSRNLLVQMIGRGLRKSRGKDNCHVIDMVSSLETGIVTTPTLFGLDPNILIERCSTRQMESLRAELQTNERSYSQDIDTPQQASDNLALKGQVAFTDYDNVNDLIQDTAGERHVRALSYHGWVQIDEGKFVLSSRSGDYLAIKKSDTVFITTHTRRLPPSANAKTPYAKPQEIAKSPTFEDAIHAADTYASASAAFPFEFISKNAYWRRSASSQGQIDFLNKFRAEDEKLDVTSITKGRAADWITKIKHGARGRFNRMSTARRREERILDRQQRWKALQERAEVKVGPIGSW